MNWEWELPKKIIKKSPKTGEPEFNRREALQMAVGGAIVGAVGTSLMKSGVERIVESREDGFEKSEIFERKVSGYRILYGRLKRNEIIFVNRDGAPIGSPIQLEPIGDVSPGEIDSNGLLNGRMNQRWLDLQRTRVCDEANVPCDLRNSLPLQLNSIDAIEEAVEVEGLNPDTFLDIVRHYGHERAENGERKIEYVRRHVMEGVSLPEVVKRELSHLLPGLAAVESRYNNASISEDGARGTFQFMPDTWRELGYTQADFASFEKQVQGAGRHFVNIYRFVTTHAGESLEKAKQAYFDGDEVTFEKFFLVPVLINAYNTGHDRMKDVVNRFLREYSDKQKLEALIGMHPDGFGLDAFIAMAREISGHDDGQQKVPRYGKHSSEYVPRIYALSDLLD